MPPTPKYLVVHLDSGRSYTIDREPTCADFGNVTAGLAALVRLRDLACWNRAKEWEPVPPGVMVVPEVPEGERLKFHFHSDAQAGQG